MKLGGGGKRLGKGKTKGMKIEVKEVVKQKYVGAVTRTGG